MKKTILGITSAIVLAASTSVSAGQTVYGTITNVVENWTYETRRIPTETCNTVRIPITGGSYSSGSSAGADALAGMIIGGILGKGLSGNDKGAAAGAVIGGVIGADKSQGRVQHSGPSYREEYRCHTTYEYTRESVQAGYIVDYMFEGYLYQFTTFKRYKAGDKIRLNIRVSPVN
jgi:uncharacterized protein YcfJ